MIKVGKIFQGIGIGFLFKLILVLGFSLNLFGTSFFPQSKIKMGCKHSDILGFYQNYTIALKTPTYYSSVTDRKVPILINVKKNDGYYAENLNLYQGVIKIYDKDTFQDDLLGSSKNFYLGLKNEEEYLIWIDNPYYAEEFSKIKIYITIEPSVNTNDKLTGCRTDYIEMQKASFDVESINITSPLQNTLSESTSVNLKANINFSDGTIVDGSGLLEWHDSGGIISSNKWTTPLNPANGKFAYQLSSTFYKYGYYKTGSKYITVTAVLSTPTIVTATPKTVTSFVQRLYKNILGRDADQGGLDNWVNNIKNGSAEVAVNGFFNSQEFLNKNQSNQDFVRTAYTTILGRNPDSTGLNNWVNRLRNSYTRSDVLEGFLKSSEFEKLAKSYGIKPYEQSATGDTSSNQNTQNTTGEKTVDSFVRRLYKNILGRDADIAGFNHWVNDIKNSSAQGVVMSFFNSQEFLNKNQSNQDFVRTAYTTILGRNPDSTGLNNWVNRLRNSYTRSDVLEGFLKSSEFEKLAKSYGIKPYEQSATSKPSNSDGYNTNYSGNYNGTFSGYRNGTWNVTISTDGTIIGSAVDDQGYNYSLQGHMNNNQMVMSDANGYITFTGTIASSNNASGTWKTGQGNTGTFQ